MTRLVCAAIVVLLSGVSVAAQGVSGGAGQTSTPQPGARGQRPGAPVPRDPAAEATRTGTARIRGRVVAADTSSPVRRAQVILIGQGRSRSMTTDADGRYEFTELPAGSYTVSASKAGFITAQNGQRRSGMPGQPIAVAAGQVRSQVDVTLPRGGVVTGRITDEFGEPLAGAQIQVQRFTYGPTGRQLSFAGSGPGGMTTDDLGQFRVYGLAAGDYIVSARMQQQGFVSGPNQDDRSEGYPPTFYPGTANVAEAQTVAVTAAQESVIQIGLVATRLARISGRVVDSQGRPAAGAMLQLSSGSANAGITMGAGQVQADGSFSLVRVPPGDHVIRVSPRPQPGGRGATLAPAALLAADPEVGVLPISVAGDDVTGVAIQMRRAARVSGRVVFEGNAARPNAQQFRVMAQPVNSQGGLSSSQFVVSADGSTIQNGQVDADGDFSLGGIFGQVLIRTTGPLPWQLKSVTLDGDDVTDALLDVTDDVERLRIVMTDRMTQVSGTVTGGAQDLESVAVVVIPREERDGMAGQRYTRALRQARADRFQIPGLPAGDYVAAAFEWLEPGSEWNPRIRDAIREAGEQFSLTEGQQRSLTLRISQEPGQ